MWTTNSRHFLLPSWFYRCPIPAGSHSPSVADCKNGVGVRVGWYVGDSQSLGLTWYFNFLITSVNCTSSSLACSRRSDSGEQYGVKKAMKSRGGPLLLPRFYFFALLFTSHRSPLSERLEQATSSSANKLKTFISKLSHLERTGGLFESHDKAK